MKEVENAVLALRETRGFSAAQLAGMAGVSRQTIYAIEAGAFVPNTAVALRLAKALDVAVEDLFRLPDDEPPLKPGIEEATLLAGGDPIRPGQPVRLCRVNDRLIASAVLPAPWFFPASDGTLAASPKARGRTKVRISAEAREFGNRILIAGCDPAISLLARHMHDSGIELVVAHRN